MEIAKTQEWHQPCIDNWNIVSQELQEQEENRQDYPKLDVTIQTSKEANSKNKIDKEKENPIITDKCTDKEKKNPIITDKCTDQENEELITKERRERRKQISIFEGFKNQETAKRYTNRQKLVPKRTEPVKLKRKTMEIRKNCIEVVQNNQQKKIIANS